MTTVLNASPRVLDHPAWCDQSRCEINPDRPGEGDHLSSLLSIPAIDDLHLEMSWSGDGSDAPLVSIEIQTPGRPGASAWLTLAQARAVQVRLSELLAAATA